MHQGTLFSLSGLGESTYQAAAKLAPLPKQGDYRLCVTPKTLEEVIVGLRQATEEDALVGIDPEFKGAGKDVKTLRPECQLVGFSVAIKDTCWYIPIRHITGETQLDPEVVRAALAPLLSKARLVTHNGKGDSHVFVNEGYPIRVYADTMTAAHFLQHYLWPHQWREERGRKIIAPFRKGLKLLSKIELGLDEVVSFDQVIERSGQKKTSVPDFSKVGLEDACAYACADAMNTLRLAEKLLPLFDLPEYVSMRRLFWDVAMPFLNLLAEMERRGVLVNPRHFEEQFAASRKRKVQVDKEIYDILKRIPDTDEKLRYLIYEQWGYPVENTTNTGKPAVDRASLIGIGTLIKKRKEEGVRQKKGDLPYDTQLEVLRLLLESAKLEKILTTYDLRRVAVATIQVQGVDFGRVHTQFNMEGTATNRLSSNGPNLQNLPSKGDWVKLIRGGVVPLPGYVWGCFDLSQIEPRGAAMIADILGDKKFGDMLRDKKRGDPYKALASALTGLSYEDIGKELRDLAKVAMLAIIYGSSAASLAENPAMRPLGKNGEPPTVEAVQKALDELFTAYPGLKKYQRNIIFWGLYRGYSESFWGFRRPAFDLASKGVPDWRKRRADDSRALRNFGIQGWAAEFLKAGMLWADRMIKELGLEDRIRIVLTVHDEIDALIREDTITIAVALFGKALTQVWNARVPIGFDAELGPSWGEVIALDKWKTIPEQDPESERIIDKINQDMSSPFEDFPLAPDITREFDMTQVPFEQLDVYAWHAANLGVSIDDPRLPLLSKQNPSGWMIDVRSWEKDGKKSYSGTLVARNGTMRVKSWDVVLKEGFCSLDGYYSDRYGSFTCQGQTPLVKKDSLELALRQRKPAQLSDGRIVRFDLLLDDLEREKRDLSTELSPSIL